MCRKNVLTIVAVAILALSASAGAVEVTIVNPGFEDPVLADGEYQYSLDNQGWGYFDNDGYQGPWNLGPSDYGGNAPEGQNIGWVNPGGVGVPGGFAQVLTDADATLKANMTYTLTVEVGNTLGWPWGGYKVQLLAGGTPHTPGTGADTGPVTGGTLLAEDNNSLTIAEDTFETSTVTYTYDPVLHSGLLGEPLQIRLLSLGNVAAGDWTEADFDNVTLSYDNPFLASNPNPADGAEGVPLGTSVSWAPGATAATNDVYFGTTNPPAFAASVEAGTYYPGPLEPGTTYYWQIDAVEADCTTIHTGDVWSFTTGFSNVEIDISIATGDDDAEEDVGGSKGRVKYTIDITSTDLEFMYDDDPNDPNDEQVVGLRFVDVGIPKGTTIASAYVQFDADDIDDDRHVGDVHILIDGELNPNPGTFENTLNNITARPRTTAIVEWDPAQWMETHLQSPDEATSDISSIIQEIVDQDGWAAGNALVLIFSQDLANPSVGIREAGSFDGAGDDTARRPRLHIEAAFEVATQPSPADGAEGVPLDATLGWWPGANTVSHNVYLDTIATTSFAMPTYLVDGDSNSLPWDVAHGTITFDGQINTYGNDPDFLSAGASGNTLDIPDGRNWAELSFDFDVDFVEFIYGGNVGNITVEARDKDGAVIASFYQADTYGGKPAGPVTLSGPGIRSLHWKDTSILPWKGPSSTKFAALDNILLTILPPELLGNTTQVSFDPGVLAPSTTYYWQVDTVEADGTTHTGAVQSFTTEPGEATQPDPADAAEDVPIEGTVLGWLPGATAAWHDVYFGTTSPPPFIGNQTEPNFDPGPLEPGTTYYWQVDEIEADVTTVYTGAIWSFTVTTLGQ